MNSGNIRNFCIIAHVDHGKSTLADRLLELTGTIEPRKMHEQFLDRHPLERERGITIKMQPVRMIYQNQKSNAKKQSDKSKSKNDPPQANTEILPFDFYILNLIDTPGHVDFSYEVSRALAAVEGAILLVDASKGIQAQTLANLEAARRAELEIIPAVNKIDLPSSEIEKTASELASLLGVDEKEIFRISAKTGQGVPKLLAAVIEKIPPPALKSNPAGNRLPKTTILPIVKTSDRVNTETPKDAPLRALVFDSEYDRHQGVIAHVRIVAGALEKGEVVNFIATGASAKAAEVGVFLPERTPKNELVEGEIGYLATGIKEPAKVRVGDTVTKFKVHHAFSGTKLKVPELVEPLPGYHEPQPMVWAGIFPENHNEFDVLGRALEKLKLNDSSLVFQTEESVLAGKGFLAGFLGTLHMEIVFERIKREYGLKLILTAPSVAFLVRTKKGTNELLRSAVKMPEPGDIAMIEEPWAEIEIVTPPFYLGLIAQLIVDVDGAMIETSNLAQNRLLLRAEAPLREIISGFHDRLKSLSRGFASSSYRMSGWRRADLTRLEIFVAGEIIPEFAQIVPREQAYRLARIKLKKLKTLLRPELFTLALQAKIDGRIIARETIPALKKDVAGYLYGGDRSRKMKLWQKQKRGKTKLAARGRVQISPEVFQKLLASD